jgi:heterodisulfide reductase subunit A
VSAIKLERSDGVLSLSEIDEIRCFGCGNCVVICPVNAISLPGWDSVEIPVQIQAALQSPTFDEKKPKIMVIACEWSAYGAADLAGARRIPYPPNVRIIRTNCSARFDPYHILWAFLHGADGVLLGACPSGECHYGSGNLFAKERMEALQKTLAEHGIDPRRLRLEFLSVDDGKRFAKLVNDFERELRKDINLSVSQIIRSSG